MHVVPKLPSGFNPREVVYRQMELIKAETVKKMNELLEGVNFMSITSNSWIAKHQHFLSVVVHGISSDFKNHLALPSFAICKAGPALKWWYCGKSV